MASDVNNDIGTNHFFAKTGRIIEIQYLLKLILNWGYVLIYVIGYVYIFCQC